MNTRICFVSFIACILSLNCLGQSSDTTIYRTTEVEATFKYNNGTSEYESCKRYFLQNFKMPAILEANGYIGKIYVEFVIEKDSTISNVKVRRGMGDSLDKHVADTVKAMPRWGPGKIKGKSVRTYFIIPVSIIWLYGNEGKGITK